MQGHYIKGVNKGHRNKREEFFNCKMYGTFNIKIEEKVDLKNKQPVITKYNTEYYLVKITKDNKFYYGYLLNWKKSKQKKTILEIVSKELFPDTLKEDTLEIEILNRWSNEKRDKWAKNIYWWQTFDWSPKARANSKELAGHINQVINWAGLTVLDMGSHYGYHSFNASKRGGIVTGVEINNSALKKSEIINDCIEMQDVSFYKYDDKTKNYDVILYLSVHHQINEDYSTLKKTLDEYKKRCNKYLVVELIMPPMFGKKYSVEEIDKMVGGVVLANYKHKVRGIRRLYFVDKKEINL